MPTAEEYRVRFPDQAQAVDRIFRELHEPTEGRSTLPDNILGSGVPNPDAPRLTYPLSIWTQARLPNSPRSMGRWDDFSAIT